MQATNLGQEIRKIKDSKALDKQNTQAQPVHGGRVGGKIKYSLLSYDEKHLVILPKESTLMALIIKSCHSRVLPGGVQQTLSLLKLSSRRMNSSETPHPLMPSASQQIMGNLPDSHVMPSRSFQHIGVDYGPIMLRFAKGRSHKSSKAFIAAFVCLSSKALLEVVSDYTADAFLAALRCFISRRDLCEVMYSDCGTNFVG